MERADIMTARKAVFFNCSRDIFTVYLCNDECMFWDMYHDLQKKNQFVCSPALKKKSYGKWLYNFANKL